MALPMKPGARPFLFRNGGQFFWKGMSTRTDLGAQPPDRPRLVLNGRIVGGHIMARPPVKHAVALVPLGFRDVDNMRYQQWLPTFMTEHHSYNGVRLWWGAPAQVLLPGATATDYQGIVGFVDTDYDLQWQTIASYTHQTPFTPIVERFANSIYIGDLGALRKVYRVQPVAQATGDEGIVRGPSDEVVASYPGFLTTALHGHEGKLYYALADPLGSVNGEIWSWDGQQQVKEYDLTVPGDDGVAMQTYQDSLIVTVRGLGSILKKSLSGAWTTHTVGGFDSSPYMNSMAELKNKLYIMDGGTKIYSWDGTTLALERTITTGLNPEGANCCVAFNGRLYYFWREKISGDGWFPWVGMHDPDTTDAAYQWDDDYKCMGTGVVTDYDTRIGTDVHYDGDHAVFGDLSWMAVAVYRQRIIAACGSILFSHAVENAPCSAWSTISSYLFAWNDTSEMPLMVGNPAGWGSSNINVQYLKAL